MTIVIGRTMSDLAILRKPIRYSSERVLWRGEWASAPQRARKPSAMALDGTLNNVRWAYELQVIIL